ncbi:hypothetical protein HHK36_022675 [Tetracentron sinense]|uniref:Uncharacterized protein n=1 Tax=Tetracentron sinense TaxID=13715 RepID=A0A834YTK9_TETSI|nr:hypothetical protein HHK36_022675 [Tetracentron sinense]
METLGSLRPGLLARTGVPKASDPPSTRSKASDTQLILKLSSVHVIHPTFMVHTYSSHNGGDELMDELLVPAPITLQ